MSHAYGSRHRGSGMSATTVLAAKVAFASAALAAAASLGRLAVPHLVSVAGAVLPRAWAVARFWLVPPYLFVTVHLIILVIWKLSDHKHFQAQVHHKDPWPVAQHPPPAAVPVAEVAAPTAVKAKEEFDYSPAEYSPDSGGGESCVTTESDEDASSSPSYVTDVRRSHAPPPEHALFERELSLPSQTVDCDGDDDLDATWNAIMQKTRSAGAGGSPSRAAIAAAAAAEGAGPVGRRGGDEPAVRRLHQEEPQLLRAAIGAPPIRSSLPAAAVRYVYRHMHLWFLSVVCRRRDRRSGGRRGQSSRHDMLRLRRFWMDCWMEVLWE